MIAKINVGGGGEIDVEDRVKGITEIECSTPEGKLVATLL